MFTRDAFILFAIFVVVTKTQECLNNNECVAPRFTCMYTEFTPTSRIYNIFVGYTNTALRDVNVSQRAYVTDGNVSMVDSITPFVASGSNYSLHVTNATYFNWTIGRNEYAWLPRDTLDNRFSCYRVTRRASCGPPGTNLEVKNFCQDASYCNGVEFCITSVNVCQSSDIIPCNKVDRACDEDSLSCVARPPAPNTLTMEIVCVSPNYTVSGRPTFTLLLQYNNTNAFYVEEDNYFDTDGALFFEDRREGFPHRYRVLGNRRRIVVSGALYVNWSASGNTFVWTIRNLTNTTSCADIIYRNTSRLCQINYARNRSLPVDFCAFTDYCVKGVCENNKCSSSDRCPSNTVCNASTFTCDNAMPIISDSPSSTSLANSPTSLLIVAIPSCIVLVFCLSNARRLFKM